MTTLLSPPTADDAPPYPPTAARSSGTASIHFSHVNGKTAVTRSHATSPLRLVSPKNSGNAVWLFTSSFGGGLLAGDHLSIDIHSGPDTTAYVSSQSSTKIYRSPGASLPARQTLTATLADRALLVLTPDPIVCFADARYHQSQRIDMPSSAGLVLLDWFTSGRHAPPRAERWQFAALRAKNELFIDGKRTLADILHLDANAGPLTHPFRMGRFNCFATLVLAGARVAPFAQPILQAIAKLPIRTPDAPLVAASPLADGLILRLAAENTEHAANFLFRQLAFLTDLLGEHPWSRKW